MATQAQPDSQEAPPNEQQGSEQLPSSTSTSQQTPPTPAPAGPTNTAYTSVLETTLKEYADQNKRLQEQLDATRGGAAPASKTAEEQRAEYFNNPHDVTRNIVREEMSATIQPLVEFVRGLDVAGSPLNRMLNLFKNDPRWSQHLLDPAVEQGVRTIMQAQGVELNTQNMQAAVVQAIGLKAAGMLPSASTPAPSSNVPQPPPPSPQPTVTTPPHFRPAPPPSNAPSSKSKIRPLTENERRLARERGQSDEEYLAWIDAPAAEVARSNIGKPEWKKQHEGR